MDHLDVFSTKYKKDKKQVGYVFKMLRTLSKLSMLQFAKRNVCMCRNVVTFVVAFLNKCDTFHVK